MKYIFTFIFSMGIAQACWSAAAEPERNGPGSFGAHVQEKLANINTIADNYIRFLEGLSSSLTGLRAFSNNIGFPVEDDNPAAVEFLRKSLEEDVGIWTRFKQVMTDQPASMPILDKAATVIEHLIMEYLKFEKDKQELSKNLEDPSRTIIIPSAAKKKVILKIPFSPTDIFMQTFILSMVQEQNAVFQTLAIDLLNSMPTPYSKDFAKYSPMFSVDYKSTVPQFNILTEKRTKARILQLILSHGYKLEIPMDLNPNLFLVPIDRIAKEVDPTKKAPNLCALHVTLSSGARFTIRNLPIEEVSQIAALAKEHLPEKPSVASLAEIYPTWATEWEVAQAKAKADKPTISAKAATLCVVAPLSTSKKTKKELKAEAQARALKDRKPTAALRPLRLTALAHEFIPGVNASKAWNPLEKSPPAPPADMAVPATPAPASDVDVAPPAAACGAGAAPPPDVSAAEAVPVTFVSASEAPLVATPILLNPHQQAMLADLLRPTDATVHPWKRVVELIEALKGTPIGDAKLGLFMFPEGKIIKIYHPCFTKGETTPLAIQSLFRGLGEVGWTRETLIAILPEAMQKLILAAEAKA